jgi:hypothetical protein
MTSKPARQAGSGFATSTATAVEELLAASLRSDAAAADRWERVLRQQRQLGNCGMPPHKIRALVESASSALPFRAASARRALPGGPGDVEAVLDDGSSIWFEVKAQTKKAKFADLTQADWVRDATDALRWLAGSDQEIRRRLKSEVVKLLTPADSGYFRGWSFSELWLADVALVTSRPDREAVGITKPELLGHFMSHKYFFHLTQEGARATLLSELPPVRDALAGSVVTYALKTNRASLVSIPVQVGGQGGGAHFSYHVYPPAVPGVLMGRHKLHARSLP